MKLIICMNGSNLSVEVSEAVYLALDENRRKAENLYHEKRRHWDARAFDESIMLLMQQHPVIIVKVGINANALSATKA